MYRPMLSGDVEEDDPSAYDSGVNVYDNKCSHCNMPYDKCSHCNMPLRLIPNSVKRDACGNTLNNTAAVELGTPVSFKTAPQKANTIEGMTIDELLEGVDKSLLSSSSDAGL